MQTMNIQSIGMPENPDVQDASPRLWIHSRVVRIVGSEYLIVQSTSNQTCSMRSNLDSNLCPRSRPGFLSGGMLSQLSLEMKWTIRCYVNYC